MNDIHDSLYKFYAGVAEVGAGFKIATVAEVGEHLEVLAGALMTQGRLEAAAQQGKAVRQVPVGERSG